MSAARAEEYAELLSEIEKSSSVDQRTIARWRQQFRRIEHRDYFRAEGRDRTRLAIDGLAKVALSAHPTDSMSS